MMSSCYPSIQENLVEIDMPKASEGRLGVTVFSTRRCNSTMMEALITRILVLLVLGRL